MATRVATLIQTLQHHRPLPPAQLAQVTRLGNGAAADPRQLCKELVQRGWLTAFQAQLLLQGKGGDLVLGSYLLLDPLGTGGSGQVFKARHQPTQRLVALKMLRRTLAGDTEAVQRFHREIEVLSQLSHPNIVRFLEAGPLGSHLVLVLEYVEGTDLERLVRQTGPVAVEQACTYVWQAAQGLQYAHERGLVHRDIKPSNLFLQQAPGKEGPGLVKVLDLGLARLEKPPPGSATAQLTVLAGGDTTQGTPEYMAPEQALDFHAADIRADLYSLGCTLYFLLTGQPPFPADTVAEKLLKHQQAAPPAVERIRPDVPPGLPAVLQKLLAKRLPERYQTPEELLQALAPWVPGQQGTALRPQDCTGAEPQRPRGSQPARSQGKRLLVMGAGLTLLGLIVVLGLTGAYPTGDAGSSPNSTRTTASANRLPTTAAVDLVRDLKAESKKTLNVTSLQVGARCYVDRAYTINKLSEPLRSGALIQTAGEDKVSKVPVYVSFALTCPAKVFVAYDSRATKIPAWLAEDTWQATREVVGFKVSNTQHTMKVYSRAFPAGPVQLGSNLAPPVSGSISQYLVIVQAP